MEYRGVGSWGVVGRGGVDEPVMNKHAKTTIAFPAAGVAGGSSIFREKCPMLANTMKQQNIHIPPVMRDLRRPKCSTMYRPPNVVPKLTPPRII
jgi:hypothetical protein